MSTKLVLMAAEIALLAPIADAHAQGYVSFYNTPLTRITNALIGQPIFGTNSFRFGFYFGPPDSAPGQLALLALATNIPSSSAIDPLAGGFSHSSLAVPGGDEFRPVQVQIRGWSFSAGESYEAAFAAARPDDPNVLLGVSEMILVWPFVGPGPITELFRPFGPLDGFTVGLIPEPSSIALGGVGAGLLLFMQAKQLRITAAWLHRLRRSLLRLRAAIARFWRE